LDPTGIGKTVFAPDWGMLGALLEAGTGGAASD
jgi:hypothetical protein